MNNDCKKLWSRKFIVENFTTKFISKTYKKHLEKVFFDKEKALLPATQPAVERLILKLECKTKIDEIQEQIKNLTLMKRNLTNEYFLIQNGHYETDLEKTERKQFIRKCGNENCRGFLSSQWKCGICTFYTCTTCHVFIENKDTHACKKEDVETAALLNKDTKSCPKCQTLIFKIDGCDQMWCTQCHTAFSWKTSCIETVVHNPHYYEYLRKTQGNVPRNIHDNPCRNNLRI
jgi:hypothetical protein